MLISIHPKDPEPRKIRIIVDKLNAGGVVICPTDTVYAFVCSAHQPRAIEQVAWLKGVKPQKADLSLICKDLSQLSTYARAVDTAAFRMMKHALPGPYTFILQASSEIPKLFKNNKRTVGIRVPDHPHSTGHRGRTGARLGGGQRTRPGQGGGLHHGPRTDR
jgi:tRNA threonylcarbamoyl adenosine modification protein (Sua5/YciO/YrdC/YwlC family)